MSRRKSEHKSEVITARVGESTLEWLDLLAEVEIIDRSNLVRMIIQDAHAAGWRPTRIKETV